MNDGKVRFVSPRCPPAEVRRAMQKVERRHRDLLLDVLLESPRSAAVGVVEYAAPLLNGLWQKQSREVSEAWREVVQGTSSGEAKSSLQLPQAQHLSSRGVAECGCCSVLQQLSVQSVTRSGSDFEQLRGLGSDFDMMYELGPLSFVIGGDTVGQPGGAQVNWITTSDSGFILLYASRQKNCVHEEQNIFSAETVRKTNHRIAQLCCPALIASQPENQRADLILTQAGPSWNVSDGKLTDIDFVPSIRVPHWPSAEFRRRRRSAGWPAASLVVDITDYGVHIVPTGLKGSKLRRHEWRISLTRAETLLCWALPHSVRVAILEIKAMKTQLPSAHKNVMKSYLLKTIAFWMVESGTLTAESSVRTCIKQLLQGLLSALDTGCLSCFCYRDINILAQFSAQELSSVRDAVTTQLMSTRQLLLSGPHQWLVTWLLHHPAHRLTSHQLQTHVTRQWLRLALERPFCVLQGKRVLDARMLLGRRVANLALCGRRRSGDETRARCLLGAVAACPPDVADAMEFRQQPDGSFTWDISAMFSLLRPSDIDELTLSNTGYRNLSAYLTEQRDLPRGQRHPGLPQELCKSLGKLTPRQRSLLLLNDQLFYSLCCATSENLLMKNDVVLDNMQLADEALVEGGVGDAWKTTKWLPFMLPPELRYPPPPCALIETGAGAEPRRGIS